MRPEWSSRINGKTGEFDPSWFPNGDLHATECCFGPDGLLYVRIGPMGYGRWLVRLDHEGNPVPFNGEAIDHPTGNEWPNDPERYGVLAGKNAYGGHPLPRALKKSGPVKAMWTGEISPINTHTRGLHVSSSGMIVAPILFNSIKKIGGKYPKYLVDHGMPEAIAPWGNRTFVAVMDTDGRYHSSNAVGDTAGGHGAFMDREGNIYAAVAGLLPKGGHPDGITDTDGGQWGGFASLVKYPWKGAFPLATLTYPAKGAKMTTREGALWVYHGLPGNYVNSCTCHNLRPAMDYWARTWIGANQLNSLVVLDANGNRIARIGRYGNVDDADPQHGNIHFAWIRAVAVSDTAVYAVDPPNRRILKAAIKYAAEETVPLRN
jgi:hypothetical protein